MSTKLETDMTYEKVVTWQVKDLYFHMAQTTKLNKMMAYDTVPPCTKSHDPLVTWLYVSRDKEKVLYLQYHKSYVHQIWHGSGLKSIKLRVVKVILLKAIKFMCP